MFSASSQQVRNASGFLLGDCPGASALVLSPSFLMYSGPLTCLYSRLRGAPGAAIGQVRTHHCRSSRACPAAFIALSVHHMSVRPVALLVFQTVPCPCLPGWGTGCGPQVLGFTTLGQCTHDTESRSWHVYGVPCLGLRYHGCACMCWPLLATHPWLHVPGVMEGSRCKKSEVSRFGCCHQPWQVLAVLRAEKPQWVLVCWS